MKRFLFFLLLFFIPFHVSAESAYIKEFEVLNGHLSLPFNEQNNIYTIYLEEEAQKVEFTYSLEDEQSSIEIIDETWTEEKENIMIVKVKSKNELETQTYTFYLEKESNQAVVLDNTEFTTLNITKKERSPYLAPMVIISCIFTIFVLFYFLIIRYMKKIKRKKKKSLT